MRCTRCKFEESDSVGWCIVVKRIGRPILFCSVICAERFYNKKPNYKRAFFALETYSKKALREYKSINAHTMYAQKNKS